MMYLPGWNQSAEDAWLTPPDPWDDEIEPKRRDMTVAEVLKCRNRNPRVNIMNNKHKKKGREEMKLYEISSEYAKFIEDFDNGDIPDDAFSDTLDSIHGVFEEKCVSIACSIKNDNAMIDALNAEIGRLTERKNAMTKRMESKKNYLLKSMDAVGVDKLKEDPRAHISIKRNPPRVVFTDPQGFLETAKTNGWMHFIKVAQPEIDKAAVKSALLNGRGFPDVYLEQGKRVDIS